MARFFASTNTDTGENRCYLYGKLSFQHSVILLHLCKEYPTAVKLNIHILLLVKY